MWAITDSEFSLWKSQIFCSKCLILGLNMWAKHVRHFLDFVAFWLDKTTHVISSLDLKHQALVYDTLPPTTAIIGYAIGLKQAGFLLVLKLWYVCSWQPKLNWAFFFFKYNCPCCLCQHKWNQNGLNQDGTLFCFNSRQMLLLFMCVFWR